MSAYTEIPKIIAETGELPPKVLGDLNSRYPGASSQSVEYFVAPPPLGDDDNDGSEDYPFATIAAAVAKLPDVIRADHEYTITLLPGEWNEPLHINHILVYGKLIVSGSTTDRTRHRVWEVRCDNILGHLEVHNITAIKDNQRGPTFWFERCAPFVRVANCANQIVPNDVVDGEGVSGVHGLLADYGSQVWVRDSDFSGKRYGIRSNFLSRVVSQDNTGEGNTNGVGARFGGILSIQGTYPQGLDNNTTASSGGIIVNSTGSEIGHDRYPADGALEQLALVGYDKMQANPREVITKRWSIRTGTQTGGAKNIPGGSALRLFFDKNTTVDMSYLIKAEFVYHTGAGTHSGVGYATPIVTQTQIADLTSSFSSITARHGSGWSLDQMIRIGHTGHSGRFYLDFAPNPSTSANAGWYGINIEMSAMRSYNTATYSDAQVVDL